MPPARRKKFIDGSRKTYAGAKKTETTGHERLASKKNLMKIQIIDEENVSTNADQLSPNDRLKIEHIRTLTGIRIYCTKAGFPANDNERIARIIRIDRVLAIERTWEILDTMQLWSNLPDAKQLTDDMRIGDHIAATRKALRLAA
jgi:hypothetical protein